MTTYYYYNAFGLSIKSDQELPELHCPLLTPIPEICISTRQIETTSIDSPVQIILPGITFQANSNTLLLSIENVARFLVSGGKSIIVEPAVSCSDIKLVRLYLLGSALGALLLQRGVLTLHGSSIMTSLGAVIFTGHSGYGKSTLTCFFNNKGYPVFSDDVSAINLISRQPYISSGYPRVLLWKDSAESLGISTSDLEQANARDDKFQVPVSINTSQPSHIYRIYVINPLPHDANFSIDPIIGFQMIQLLTEHTYRIQFLESMGLTNIHFNQVNAVATSIEMFRINRPNNFSRINEHYPLIEEHIFQNRDIL